MTDIRISKAEQYYHEVLTWKRVLDFFKDENSFLKTRLSKVVDQHVDDGFLEPAEQYQNSFISKDEYINELRHEVNIQETKLKETIEADLKIPTKTTLIKQTELRTNIEFLEKEFTKLKNEFNKYLNTIL